MHVFRQLMHISDSLMHWCIYVYRSSVHICVTGSYIQYNIFFSKILELYNITYIKYIHYIVICTQNQTSFSWSLNIEIWSHNPHVARRHVVDLQVDFHMQSPSVSTSTSANLRPFRRYYKKSLTLYFQYKDQLSMCIYPHYKLVATSYYLKIIKNFIQARQHPSVSDSQHASINMN